MYEVVEAILDQPTQSLTDLKLQIQAYALAESHAWIGAENDEHRIQISTIIDLIGDFFGFDPLPYSDHLRRDRQAIAQSTRL